MVVELVEEELLLMVVWLVLAVTALTLGMVVDRMGVQVEMMVERIIRLGKASLVMCLVVCLATCLVTCLVAFLDTFLVMFVNVRINDLKYPPHWRLG